MSEPSESYKADGMDLEAEPSKKKMSIEEKVKIYGQLAYVADLEGEADNDEAEPTPPANSPSPENADIGVGSSDWLALGWPLDLYRDRHSFGAFIQGEELVYLLQKYDKGYGDRLQSYMEMEAKEGGVYEDEDGFIRIRGLR